MIHVGWIVRGGEFKTGKWWWVKGRRLREGGKWWWEKWRSCEIEGSCIKISNVITFFSCLIFAAWLGGISRVVRGKEIVLYYEILINFSLLYLFCWQILHYFDFTPLLNFVFFVKNPEIYVKLNSKNWITNIMFLIYRNCPLKWYLCHLSLTGLCCKLLVCQQLLGIYVHVFQYIYFMWYFTQHVGEFLCFSIFINCNNILNDYIYFH